LKLLLKFDSGCFGRLLLIEDDDEDDEDDVGVADMLRGLNAVVVVILFVPKQLKRTVVAAVNRVIRVVGIAVAVIPTVFVLGYMIRFFVIAVDRLASVEMMVIYDLQSTSTSLFLWLIYIQFDDVLLLLVASSKH
jgi:hypothetical protein